MEAVRNTAREQLVMKLASGLTIVLLLLPLFISWQYNLSHPGWFFARALVFLLVFLVLLWRLCVHIEKPWLRETLAVVGVILLAVFSASRLVSFYFQGKSFNEEFFFHFGGETAQFALTAFRGLLVLGIGYVVLAGVAAWLSIYRSRVVPLGNRTLLLPMGLLLMLAVDPDIATLAINRMTNANAGSAIQLSTIDWEGNGLDRNALYKMTDEITAGKNVVMIYLEGLEHLYTEQDLYPGLTPFLSSLEDSALHFEHMYQSRGTTFTVAGILSSQCGTPLLYPQGPGGNDILRNGFLQEGFCFGDILHAAGYHQVFMGGASTRFAGKGVFLSAHGYDEVLGKEELQPLMDDPAYMNYWGLYDDTLLQLAAEKFDELAASPEPFNFTVLTVDTHPPDGTVSKSCEPYPAIDSSIFQAVHCTDQLVGRFVDHIRRSPVWNNTVVLLMSDHLHMRNSGMSNYPPGYDRRLLVNILNAGQTGIVESRGVHMDIAPTLLNLMGVRHNQAFLAGIDMLSPDREARWVDPDTGLRERTIRYINTNLLSRIEVGLCEAQPLYNYSDNRLTVAGREIDLSLAGRTLNLADLGTTFALVTLVNREGLVGLTFPVSVNNLAYVLFQFRQYSFFIMAPAMVMNRLYPDIDAGQGLGLVYGNMQDSFHLLETNIALDLGFDIGEDCGAMRDQARRNTRTISVEALGQICQNTVPAGTEWFESEGRLRLGSVAYGAERFQAELRRDDRGWYTVTTLNTLAAEPDPASCDAYYGNMEILIPGVATENGPSSMILNKVPGVTLTFEVGEVTPLPVTE